MWLATLPAAPNPRLTPQNVANVPSIIL